MRGGLVSGRHLAISSSLGAKSRQGQRSLCGEAMISTTTSNQVAQRARVWMRGIPLVCTLASACLSAPQILDERTEPYSLTGQTSDQPQTPIRLEDFDPPGIFTIYLPRSGGWQPVSYRDCNQEQIQCFRDCWNVDPPWPRERAVGALFLLFGKMSEGVHALYGRASNQTHLHQSCCRSCLVI